MVLIDDKEKSDAPLHSSPHRENPPPPSLLFLQIDQPKINMTHD